MTSKHLPHDARPCSCCTRASGNASLGGSSGLELRACSKPASHDQIALILCLPMSAAPFPTSAFARQPHDAQQAHVVGQQIPAASEGTCLSCLTSRCLPKPSTTRSLAQLSLAVILSGFHHRTQGFRQMTQKISHETLTTFSTEDWPFRSVPGSALHSPL